MKIINIGILAHVDAGKTTLTESLLYTSGAIEAPGSVDQGTTRTDTMFLERQRGITIQTAVTSFQWHDCKVNIVDTPGHMDFLAEVYRSLAILDGAILVVSAKDGVQAQTRILFHALQVMKIPTVIFINKIDQDGIDLPGVYQSIRDKLSANMIIKQNVQLSPDISIMENMGLENWDIHGLRPCIVRSARLRPGLPKVRAVCVAPLRTRGCAPCAALRLSLRPRWKGTSALRLHLSSEAKTEYRYP